MDSETNKPNPGTREAELIGCICPVIDNHYGDGVPDGLGGVNFWKNTKCVLHGTSKDELKKIKEDVRTA